MPGTEKEEKAESDSESDSDRKSSRVKEKSGKMKHMTEFEKKRAKIEECKLSLPVFPFRQQLLDAIESHQVRKLLFMSKLFVFVFLFIPAAVWMGRCDWVWLVWIRGSPELVWHGFKLRQITWHRFVIALLFEIAPYSAVIRDLILGRIVVWYSEFEYSSLHIQNRLLLFVIHVWSISLSTHEYWLNSKDLCRHQKPSNIVKLLFLLKKWRKMMEKWRSLWQIFFFIKWWWHQMFGNIC